MDVGGNKQTNRQRQTGRRSSQEEERLAYLGVWAKKDSSLPFLLPFFLPFLIPSSLVPLPSSLLIAFSSRCVHLPAFSFIFVFLSSPPSHTALPSSCTPSFNPGLISLLWSHRAYCTRPSPFFTLDMYVLSTFIRSCPLPLLINMKYMHNSPPP